MPRSLHCHCEHACLFSILEEMETPGFTCDYVFERLESFGALLMKLSTKSLWKWTTMEPRRLWRVLSVMAHLGNSRVLVCLVVIVFPRPPVMLLDVALIGLCWTSLALLGSSMFSCCYIFKFVFLWLWVSCQLSRLEPSERKRVELPTWRVLYW